MDQVPEPEYLGDTNPEAVRNRKQTLTSYSSRDLFGALGSFSVSTINEEDTVIRKGLLFKKGVINKGWKKRIFVLTSSSLMYYDRQPKDETVPKGEIDVDLIYKIERNENFKFNLITPTRCYRLRAQTASDRDAWIGAIYGALENNKQHQQTRSRMGSDIFDDAAFVSSAGPSPHTPAELNKWQKWNAFEVAAWLTTFGFAKHSVKFFQKGVTGAELESLSTADLENLGIASKDDQLKILMRVKKLVQEDGFHGAFQNPPKPGFEM